MDAIIIKYYMRSVLPGLDSAQMWAKVVAKTSEEDPVPKVKLIPLERAQALEYIRENGLVLSHEDENGKIWDTPDGDFQRLYKGNIRIVI